MNAILYHRCSIKIYKNFIRNTAHNGSIRQNCDFLHVWLVFPQFDNYNCLFRAIKSRFLLCEARVLFQRRYSLFYSHYFIYTDVKIVFSFPQAKSVNYGDPNGSLFDDGSEYANSRLFFPLYALNSVMMVAATRVPISSNNFGSMPPIIYFVPLSSYFITSF